ncbi:hypothetical protein I7I50_00026 [Histoplasma capsulatum G186AR]|uniref:Uncharacterized protein n=1 Tax=Ajellomyces capsulatus TaxID=5037 RepID=A0A8H7YIX2_AJECA|nr:hypothetical protein I7I52_07295 [Histoplasma capsulatum]QSS72235.1 hypothetical protein I7I50_00026 [Histoplasma capsulatum G186AR]
MHEQHLHPQPVFMLDRRRFRMREPSCNFNTKRQPPTPLFQINRRPDPASCLRDTGQLMRRS